MFLWIWALSQDMTEEGRGAAAKISRLWLLQLHRGISWSCSLRCRQAFWCRSEPRGDKLHGLLCSKSRYDNPFITTSTSQVSLFFRQWCFSEGWTLWNAVIDGGQGVFLVVWEYVATCFHILTRCILIHWCIIKCFEIQNIVTSVSPNNNSYSLAVYSFHCTFHIRIHTKRMIFVWCLCFTYTLTNWAPVVYHSDPITVLYHISCMYSLVYNYC